MASGSAPGIGPGANLASLGEKSRQLIFPHSQSLREKIPIWMKFYCYEYTSTAMGRVAAQTAAGGGGQFNIPGLKSKEKASIFIPAPVNFQTNTSHKYSAEALQAQNLFSNVFGDVITTLLDKAGIDVEELMASVDQALTLVEEGFGDVTGLNSSIHLDTSDAMFTNSGPSRSYEIRMNLPCLTEQDSQSAAAIIRAFEALSLPTARSSIIGGLSTTKAFHPPLWVFGVGPIDQRKFDQDWTGTPQICVLRSVSHKKTAFETNALAALGHNTLLKPVAYTLTLSFLELEPAFRATTPFGETSTNVINRSTVMMTTGSSGVLRTGI